uniref:Kinesin motor domain-containing protein n=1 Tax=Brugia timori TaxID=42155 RepID=A0A0R3QWY2_9BILA
LCGVTGLSNEQSKRTHSALEYCQKREDLRINTVITNIFINTQVHLYIYGWS